ncbi:MAG: hypothetical protein IPN29_07845 [Saprospiraceae bacterium]|nr:hypothetical protein [Saprospiraceae bacterium]
MRTYLTFLALLLFIACSKKAPVFNETRQADFYLNAGKVYFQKVYTGSVSFISAEKELTAHNSPTGGIQVKQMTEDKIMGVILAYPVDWQSYMGKRIKAIEDMKRPLNATFEIEKNGNSYTVTVRNIWFTDGLKSSNQQHNVIENYIVQDDGFSFRKDKNSISIIHHLSQRLESWFFLKGGGLGDRF